MSTQLAIAITILLIAANAFFVAAEFALISARRSAIEPMVKGGSKRARVTLGAMEHVSLMMAGAQLGITVCSLGIGALGEPAVAHALEPLLSRLGLPSSLQHTLAFVIALAIVVYLHMVIGEMVPKNVALAGPERAALMLAAPMAAIVRVAYPVIWLFNATANLILRVLGVQPRDEITSAFTSEEVARLVAESRDAGLLDLEDERLLTSALDITVKPAAAAAVPLDTLTALPEDATPLAVQDATAQTGYSRILLRGHDGELVGYTHVKDTLDLELWGLPLPARARRSLPLVAGDSSLTEAIGVMLDRGSHLAGVTRDGGVVGVLFLEDALEELIGEVLDPAHSGPVPE